MHSMYEVCINEGGLLLAPIFTEQLFMELSNFKRDTGRMRCPLEVMGWELIFIVDLYGKADERGTSKRMSERARDQERNKEREKEKE